MLVRHPLQLIGGGNETGVATALILDALVRSVVSVVTSVAPAVSYVELRQVKEGTSVDELAEIFS